MLLYNCESCVLLIVRIFMYIRNDVYDYAEVKVKRVVEIQNKETITPRVQLHQNVCYAASTKENRQHHDQYVHSVLCIQFSYLYLQDGCAN